MERKIILALILAITMPAFADTCPTVKDIKTHKLAGWKAYDSEDGKPLSKRRAADFIKSADQFILAEWSKRGKNANTMHCFYRDINGSDLEAYLTKDHLIPNQTHAWYRVSGAMQCAASNNMCQFAHLKNQPTFARK